MEPLYRNQPEQYAKLMHDSIHVNYLGNLIMGMHVSRAFQLPDLQLPQDIMQETLQLKEQMIFAVRTNEQVDQFAARCIKKGIS